MVVGTVSARQLAELLGAWRTGRPAYHVLAEAIRRLVLDGRLPVGTQVPSERSLAERLRVSRTTVTQAYARLREAGFLAGRRGAVSMVTVPRGARTRPPGGIAPAEGVRTGIGPAADATGGSTGLPGPAAGVTGGVTGGVGIGTLDLAIAAPEAPPGIGPAVEAAAAALPAYLTGHGYTPLGIPVLRHLLADWFTARGVPTTAGQILVTGGALQALGLVLQAFAAPGDRVLVEHPTYPNALVAIRAAAGRPVPAPLGGSASEPDGPDGPDGLDLDRFEATLRQSAPRLAYLIPDFHNPTGRLLPDADRRRLAGLLHRTGTLTVVDETLTELALDPSAAAPFASYARAGHDLITVGSAGKAYWGGLGVGWLRAPDHLVPALLSARSASDFGPAVLAQLTVTELLSDRERVLAERRATLRTRRAALAEFLRTDLPDWRFRSPPGGLALWCELPRPVASALAVAADRHGVRLAPGPLFGTDGAAFERYVRLPYTLPEADLAEAVRRIAIAYAEVESSALQPDRLAVM